MAPVGEGSNPFTHPNAPVAQLDRASDFESAGRPFEPDRARPKPHWVQGSIDHARRRDPVRQVDLGFQIVD